MVDKQIGNTIRIWKEFADRQRNKSFALNSDKTRVESLAKGVLHNETAKGLKFCPCRLTTKNREKDLKLICPCNFESQKTWEEKGECWCSLFVKGKR